MFSPRYKKNLHPADSATQTLPEALPNLYGHDDGKVLSDIRRWHEFVCQWWVHINVHIPSPSNWMGRNMNEKSFRCLLKMDNNHSQQQNMFSSWNIIVWPWYHHDMNFMWCGFNMIQLSFNFQHPISGSHADFMWIFHSTWWLYDDDFPYDFP